MASGPAGSSVRATVKTKNGPMERVTSNSRPLLLYIGLAEISLKKIKGTCLRIEPGASIDSHCTDRFALMSKATSLEKTTKYPQKYA